LFSLDYSYGAETPSCADAKTTEPQVAIESKDGKFKVSSIKFRSDYKVDDITFLSLPAGEYRVTVLLATESACIYSGSIELRTR
jgi:hypothetical protein